MHWRDPRIRNTIPTVIPGKLAIASATRNPGILKVLIPVFTTMTANTESTIFGTGYSFGCEVN